MEPGKDQRESQPQKPDRQELKKGRVLVVRVPPFYDREYLYEISGAGGKLVRANLFHSPRVKKQWSFDDLDMLFANGMIRFADEADLEKYKQQLTDTANHDGD